jgi:hypothetical protein
VLDAGPRADGDKRAAFRKAVVRDVFVAET